VKGNSLETPENSNALLECFSEERRRKILLTGQKEERA
jgi:hypothetical protein